MRSTFPKMGDPERDRAVMMSQRYKMAHSTGKYEIKFSKKY